MPPVRSVSFTDNRLTLIDGAGSKTLLKSDIPAKEDTLAKIEAHLNDVWGPATALDYQVRVHVFRATPLQVTVGTFDLGVKIPDLWWQD